LPRAEVAEVEDLELLRRSHKGSCQFSDDTSHSHKLTTEN
jgi:hypothetical protein